MNEPNTSPPDARAGTAAGRRRADLMDPVALSEVGGLEVIAREVVEGFYMGLHRSPHRGFSAEFAEHRAYQAGDDLRYIDWRMYGRSDRFYVKQFEEETNLRAYLLLDNSLSMAWSSQPGTLATKSWYAKHLLACIALLLLGQGDLVGFASFHHEIQARLGPSGGRKQWHEVIRRVSPLEPTGLTSAHSALRDIAGRLRRRGLIVLLSDLLIDPEETRLALRFLKHYGHEVLVFHILDPGERELPPAGDVRFFDPESREEIQISVPDMRLEYREAVASAIAEWERATRPYGIDYCMIETSQPFSLALRTYLRKRQRLG